MLTGMRECGVGWETLENVKHCDQKIKIKIKKTASHSLIPVSTTSHHLPSLFIEGLRLCCLIVFLAEDRLCHET